MKRCSMLSFTSFEKLNVKLKLSRGFPETILKKDFKL